MYFKRLSYTFIYSATIFDAKWKVETHTVVAQVLWNAIVFEENIFILFGNLQVNMMT
jgi:hypothetical protein